MTSASGPTSSWRMQAARGWVRQIPRRQQDEIADRYIKALDIRPDQPRTAGAQPLRRQPAEGAVGPLAARSSPACSSSTSPPEASTSAPRRRSRSWSPTSSEKGMAVIFISAELEEVLRLSHRVGVLRDRRKVAEIVQRRPHRRGHHGGHRRGSGAARMSRLTSQPAPVARRRARRAAAGQPAVATTASCRITMPGRQPVRAAGGHPAPGRPGRPGRPGHDPGHRHPRHRPVRRRGGRDQRFLGVDVHRVVGGPDLGHRGPRRGRRRPADGVDRRLLGTVSWSPSWGSSRSSRPWC